MFSAPLNSDGINNNPIQIQKRFECNNIMRLSSKIFKNISKIKFYIN